MPKRKPPKLLPEPLDKSIEAYYEAKLLVFEFESREALSAQDWERLKTLFLDFGNFLAAHPLAVNSTGEPLG